jgi:hypothetical protein
VGRRKRRRERTFEFAEACTSPDMKVTCGREEQVCQTEASRGNGKKKNGTNTEFLLRRNLLELAHEPVALLLVVGRARVVRQVVLELGLAMNREGTVREEESDGRKGNERVELVDGGRHEVDLGEDGHLRREGVSSIWRRGRKGRRKGRTGLNLFSRIFSIAVIRG